MSGYEKGSGPVEIAGVTGRIIGVGARQVEVPSDHYPTREEFQSAARAEERGLEQDKKHVADMPPRWRAERQQRFDQAFDEWKRDRKEREARLFAAVNGEDQAFPTAAEHVRRLRP